MTNSSLSQLLSISSAVRIIASTHFDSSQDGNPRAKEDHYNLGLYFSRLKIERSGLPPTHLDTPWPARNFSSQAGGAEMVQTFSDGMLRERTVIERTNRSVIELMVAGVPKELP